MCVCRCMERWGRKVIETKHVDKTALASKTYPRRRRHAVKFTKQTRHLRSWAHGQTNTHPSKKGAILEYGTQTNTGSALRLHSQVHKFFGWDFSRTDTGIDIDIDTTAQLLLLLILVLLLLLMRLLLNLKQMDGLTDLLWLPLSWRWLQTVLP